MKISLWAEIRRLHEREGLSGRAIAQRLHCSTKTVAKGLAMTQPPGEKREPYGSILDPFRPRIDALIAKYPNLTAMRVLEKISRDPAGYRGSVYPVRRYLRQIRPARGRVYQEVFYEPGEAMQVDWGDCGRLKIGADFAAGLGLRGRALLQPDVLHRVQPLAAEGGVLPRRGPCPGVLSRQSAENDLGQSQGGGPERLGTACLSASGLPRPLRPLLPGADRLRAAGPGIERDRRSERAVRQAQRSGGAGRGVGPLGGLPPFRAGLARRGGQCPPPRDHQGAAHRPLPERTHPVCVPLPLIPFDTDEILSVVVTSHARVRYDGNRYSVPPALVRKPVTLRANATEVRIIDQGREMTRHTRCYEKGQLIVHPEDRLAALKLRRRRQAGECEEEFDALGPVAREFHLKLLSMPVKTTVHLRRLLGLVRLYGRQDVLAAIVRALEYQIYDAAYVETLLLQERRRRELPFAHAPATQTPRTDRRHSPGRARPGPLRPAVRQFRTNPEEPQT